MMSQQNSSKQKVMDAASDLFYQRGFSGTSVRDIAEHADVNISLISYYFKNKQGLFEDAVITYYEAYLETIENTLPLIADLSPVDQLKTMITTIIKYKQDNHQLSCFVHRELSLDSTFVREMSVTYLAKENYYVHDLFLNILSPALKKNDRDFLYLQLKSMITAPFILQHEWKKQAMDDYFNQLFSDRYARTIHDWIDYLAKPEGHRDKAETKK